MPPESVTTFKAFWSNAMKSMYPTGSNVLTLEHFKSLSCNPKVLNIFFVLGWIGNTNVLSISDSKVFKS